MTAETSPETGASGDERAPLERSQQAIDEAKDAVREALQDSYPGSDMDAPGTGDGLEEDQEEVAPRPN